MMKQLKLQDTLILAIILGSLLYQGCSLLLKPIPSSTETCTHSDIEKFEHCFGSRGEDQYIVIESANTPESDDDCEEFQVIGWGSGLFDDIGEVLAFSGSFTSGNEIAVTFSTEEGNFEGSLQRDDASSPLNVEIQTEPVQTVSDLMVCPLPPNCIPHGGALISGCFQHETIEGHWLQATVSISDCNMIQGRLRGIFADFESAGVGYWEFDGAIIGPNQARLRILAEGTENNPRTVEIGRSFDGNPLHLFNAPGDPAHAIIEGTLHYLGGVGECP